VQRPDGAQRRAAFRAGWPRRLPDASFESGAHDPRQGGRAATEQIRALLHQSPRTFGQPTSVWTLELVAEVSFAEGITAERVTGETIRQAIGRLDVRWKRAKQWITSPDPEYARKKVRATA